MDKIQKRLQHIKWLQSVGVEYYCSLEQKDSKNLLTDHIEHNKVQISSNKLSKHTPLPPLPKQIPTPLMNKTPRKNKTTETLKLEPIKKARSLADSAENLSDLYEKLCNFDGCDLKNFATNTVFAEGVSDAEILLIGEAPGATEDEKGVPFCGESGQLLDKMISTIGLSRQTNAYITNTIFWRPPANRRPTPEEIEICRPFFEKHIALKKPKLIILVGGTATNSLLGPDKGISKIRSDIYQYSNPYLTNPIPTTALFHPAYLLRQPFKKKDTWYDLLKIKEMLTKLSIKI